MKRVSTVLMVFALLWLTVSTPFVYNAQKTYAVLKTLKQGDGGTDNNNPLSGSTEEKAPDNNNLSEYLHDWDAPVSIPVTHSQNHFPFSVKCYIAFHGDLVVPPPKV